MERPFDYTGRDSDTTAPDEHDMKRAGDSVWSYRYDACGGNQIYVTGWYVPDWWTDADIHRIACEKFPREHCQHSYDCCGKYYSNGARVIDIMHNMTDNNDERAHLVLIKTTYTQNV